MIPMNCMQFRNPSKQEDVGTDGEHLKGFLRSSNHGIGHMLLWLSAARSHVLDRVKLIRDVRTRGPRVERWDLLDAERHLV